MRNRDKIQQELARRLAEVTWYRDNQIDEQDLARDFFGRVADYLNYIKVNKQLCNFVEKLKQDRKNINIDKDLEKEGNEILDKLEKDFQEVNKIVKKNKVDIKPFVGANGVMSDEQALSLDHLQLESYFKKENHYVGDIPSHISTLWSMNGTLESFVSNEKDKERLKEISKEYYTLYDRYKEKLRLQSNWISFLRFDDYEVLLDAWNYYFDPVNPNELSILRVELGEVLGEGIIMPSLSQRNKEELEKNKQKYLLHINRFHNYLIDKLEEKTWLEETWEWLWDNFGKGIASIVILLLLTYLFKILGFTVPVDLINALLGR